MNNGETENPQKVHTQPEFCLIMTKHGKCLVNCWIVAVDESLNVSQLCKFIATFQTLANEYVSLLILILE